MATLSGYQRDLDLQAEEAFRRQQKRARRTRICLVCDQPFPSWGAGNRICARCRRQVNEDAAGVLYECLPTSPDRSRRLARPSDQSIESKMGR